MSETTVLIIIFIITLILDNEYLKRKFRRIRRKCIYCGYSRDDEADQWKQHSSCKSLIHCQVCSEKKYQKNWKLMNKKKIENIFNETECLTEGCNGEFKIIMWRSRYKCLKCGDSRSLSDIGLET